MGQWKPTLRRWDAKREPVVIQAPHMGGPEEDQMACGRRLASILRRPVVVLGMDAIVTATPGYRA